MTECFVCRIDRDRRAFRDAPTPKTKERFWRTLNRQVARAQIIFAEKQKWPRMCKEHYAVTEPIAFFTSCLHELNPNRVAVP